MTTFIAIAVVGTLGLVALELVRVRRFHLWMEREHPDVWAEYLKLRETQTVVLTPAFQRCFNEWVARDRPR